MSLPTAASVDVVDPVDAAFANAPFDDRAATAEEEEALRAARAEVGAGARLIPHAEVMRLARDHLGEE